MAKKSSKTEPLVRAVFRVGRENDKFVIFPDLVERNGDVTIWDASGGHTAGPCGSNVRSSRPATDPETAEMKRQLERGYGYRIKVIKRCTRSKR